MAGGPTVQYGTHQSDYCTGAGALLRNHIEETALPIERSFITDLYRIRQESRNY